MTHLKEIDALLLLNSIPLIGPVKIRYLIDHFGSALKAINAPSAQLAGLPGFSPRILESWNKHVSDENYKNEWAVIEKFNISLLSYKDENYPKRLLELPDYPPLLYMKGNYTEKDQKCLAVIGTRQASVYGLEMAKKISFELARAGFTIVSGFARGIDTAAHYGALEGGRTVAVLGSGLERLYPVENASLAEKVIRQGALMSEFPLFASPNKSFFPRRNRLVSGMVMGVILIEAPLQSGAMLTMENGLSQGRPLFVLPGRADTGNFKGNHALIKQNKAILIENSEDILNFFGCTPSSSSSNSQACFDFFPLLDKEEESLFRALPKEEVSIEDMMHLTKLPIHQLNVLLMSLLLKQVIREYPGKIYKKC